MIKSFKHKGLKVLFAKGSSAKIRPDLQERCLVRLDALNVAERPEDMDVPGFDFHRLRGRPPRYTVHVNGPRCITFEFIDGDAHRLDLEHYH